MTHPQPEIIVGGDWSFMHGIHRFSHEAMATAFEIFIQHENARYAQQAARAAFSELERLEAELSRFIENSDISRINNLAANQSLRIGLDAFECIRLSMKICAETDGAFDVTADTKRIESLAECSDIPLIKLDEAGFTVELLSGNVQIDLGGIGKGYALDRMAELLRDWSIDTALLHGGYSSVLALDTPPKTKGWPVTISKPSNHKKIISILHLHNLALSSSSLERGPHIIDPRMAKPVEGKIAAWACAPDAATADALSTAFMVMSTNQIKKFCSHHPQVQAMVMLKGRNRLLHFGL
jgi:thiamine biosynthesis lipoprotein